MPRPPGPITPTAVHRVDLATGKATELVAPNAHLLDGIVSPTWKQWSFRNSRGEDIEAWYWLPPGFDSTKKYPTIVHYYGGTLAMKKNFETRLNYFASQGYVVLFMNPAGAPGYGQKFSNYHINDWGYPAASDIIEGTEQFTKTHAFVDGDHIGNFGHSYGGFMTTWIATKTNRFKAIQTDRTITDWTYWYGSSDAQGLTEFEFYGKPWDNQKLYDSLSPIRYVNRVKTPMLLVQSEEDHRTPMGSAEIWFMSLKKQGVPVELIRYPRSTHDLSRTGEPWLLVDRLGRIRQWFAYWLQGEKPKTIGN